MRSRPARTRRLVALAAVAGLGLSACSTGADEPGAAASTSPPPSPSATSPSPSPSATPTGDVTVPDGVTLTAPGANLAFGETATVEFSPPGQKRSTLLEMTVTGARKAKLSDFSRFILDTKDKKQGNYYYVDVVVKNIGEKNVGGARVPLWGVNAKNTLLPAVRFTSKFARCPSTPLPDRFRPGRSVETCQVYLSRRQGSLESLSFRPDQSFDPIEWTGKIASPKRGKQASKKSGAKKSGGNG